MTAADHLRSLADVVEACDVDGITVRDTALPAAGDAVATITLAVDLEADPQLGTSTTGSDPTSMYSDAVVPVDDENDVDDQDDADDHDESNPYAPTDYGALSVRERDRGAALNIPKRVTRDIDADRIHIRERDGRIEVVPGSSEEWPDYAATDDQGPSIGTTRVIEDMLDVVVGDEVRAEPDGDVVVLEPNRIADRPLSNLPTFEAICDELTELQAEVFQAIATEGEASASDLRTATGQDSGIYDRLSALEEKDIVETRPDPDDGRVTLYSLTEAVPLPTDGDETADSEADDGAESTQSRPDQLADGGAQATSQTGASAICQSCGSHVAAAYARVHTPEDEDDPRMCPHCSDKVRERDGTIRESRSSGGQ